MPTELDFDSTDLLFHFTKAETAVNDILPSGKLRLSPLGRTGDPIEYRFFDIMIAGTNLPEFGAFNRPWGEAVAAIDRVRREESFVACFCKRYTEFERTLFDVTVEERSPYSRSRMWSQYAEDHTGACLVFDRDRLVKTAQQYAPGALVTADLVRYQNGPFIDALPPIDFNRLDASEPEAYARDYLAQNAQDVYLAKDSDYRDESEFRIVMNAEDTDYLFLDIRGSLVGLILGDRFPTESVPVVREAIADCNAEVVRLDWTSRFPSLLRPDEEVS